MIQGSVSFDNQAKDDCTELLLEIHYHLGDWWSDATDRYIQEGKRIVDGNVTCIDNKLWTPADKKKYGLISCHNPVIEEWSVSPYHIFLMRH